MKEKRQSILKKEKVFSESERKIIMTQQTTTNNNSNSKGYNMPYHEGFDIDTCENSITRLYHYFIKDDNSDLFRLPLFTGLGKTYAVHELFREIDWEKVDRFFFFVAPTKENLKIDDLKDEVFGEKDFEKYVLVLKKNLDMFDENYKKNIDKMKKYFNKNRLQQKLKFNIKGETIDIYKEVLNYNKKLNYDIDKYPDLEHSKNESYKSIRKNIYRAFNYDFDEVKKKRYDCNAMAIDESKSYNKKLKNSKFRLKEKTKFMNSSKNWRWLKWLFPEILFLDKKLIVLTRLKYNYHINSIIDKTFKFREDKVFDNAVLFIDEIDECLTYDKKYCFNEIEKVLVDRILLSNVIANIIIRANNNENHKVAKYKRVKPKEWGELYNSAKRYSEKYELINDYHFVVEIINNARHQIFYSINKINLINNKNYKLKKLKSLNQLCLLEKGFNGTEELDKTINLQDLINLLNTIIYKFLGLVFMLANLIQKESNSELEDCIRRVLNDFDISTVSIIGQDQDDTINFCVNNIMKIVEGTNLRRKPDGKINIKENSHYAEGISLTKIIESDSLKQQSEIISIDSKLTPEILLARDCNNKKVIAMSATLNYKTSLKNYNYDWIINKTTCREYVPTKELIDDLNKTIKEHVIKLDIDKYLNCYPSIFRERNNCNETFNEVKNEIFKISKKPNKDEVTEVVENLKNNIEQYFPETKSYEETRRINNEYAQVVCMLFPLTRFIINKYQKSMILFTTKNYLKDEKYGEQLSKKICEYANSLEKIINIDKENKTDNQEIFIYCANTKNFKDIKKEYEKKLRDGKKIILFTTNASLGTGININYKIPKIIRDLRETNKEEYDKYIYETKIRDNDYYKDFDVMYLGLPTNLVPNGENELLEIIYTILSLEYEGEISNDDIIHYLRSAAYNADNFLKKNAEELKECRSWFMAICIILGQATGRLPRTAYKCAQTEIYFHSEIFKKEILNIDENFENENHPYFVKLIKDAYKYLELDKTKVNELDKSNQKQIFLTKLTNGNRQNMRTIKYYQNEVFNNKNEEARSKIEELRKQLLQTGITASDNSKNLDQFYFKNILDPDMEYDSYYVKIDKDEHSEEIRQHITDIQFNCGDETNVSRKDWRIDSVFDALPNFKKYYSKTYTTETKPSKDLIKPYPYIIMKGEFGEVLGRWYFNEFLNINLDKLPITIWEKFDAMKKSLFIDFKYYKPTDKDKININKIQEKINKINRSEVQPKPKLILYINTCPYTYEEYIKKEFKKEQFTEDLSVPTYHISNIFKYDNNNNCIIDFGVIDYLTELIKNYCPELYL